MNLLLDLLRRVYAAVLLLLPRDIRNRHGAEMRDTSRRIVDDTLRRRGAVAALAAAFGECVDVIAAAARASRRAPSEFRQDLAYAWRLTWTRPAFTLMVVATLAVGIGATTSVFSVVNAVLLRPLPYGEPERLMLLTATGARGEQTFMSPRDFYDITGAVPSFESATALRPQQVNLTGDGEPERVDAAGVSWNFFDVMRVRPALGRGFLREEGEAGRENVLVISHALWQRRFGGDPAVVGRSVMLNGEPFTIVGVAPAHVTLPGRVQLWRPLVFTPRQLDPSQRGARWILVLARVKSGVPIEQAAAEVVAAGARLAADHPRTHRGRGAAIKPLKEQLVSDARPGLLALFAAVALVLLIACANVANLLLARWSGRVNEMAVRMALGASRMRLLRQLLVENLLLTSIAAVAGLALAAWSTAAAVRLLPEAVPRAGEIGIDVRVGAFAVGAAVVLAIVLGAVAALGVRSQGLSASPRLTRGGARVARRTLIVAEVAMALVLLAAAGLFVKSLSRLYGVAPGFDPARVLTFSLTLPSAAYPEPDRIARFVERLRSELAAQPGVESAAAIFGLPLTDDFSASGTFAIAGQPADPEDEPLAMVRVVTPDYLRTMRIPLIAGREFSPRDTLDQPGVVIVNEAAARAYWPGRNPIGETIKMHVGVAGVKQPAREVVGIVADVRYDGLDTRTRPETYIPHAQHPVDQFIVTLRARGEPAALVSHARDVLRELDPNLPMSAIATMEEIVDASVAARRVSLMLLGAFAGIAIVLAAIGIYGVLSYTVGQRRKEIGVRMAMGAARAHVLRLVVGEGVALAAAGLVVGLGGTVALARVIRGMLYEVEPYDPATLGLVAAGLMVVALAASYLPARRAASVDPAMTLRSE